MAGHKVELGDLDDQNETGWAKTVATTLTDENGVYTFHNVRPGKYTTRIGVSSYVQGNSKIEVKGQPKLYLAQIHTIRPQDLAK